MNQQQAGKSEKPVVVVGSLNMDLVMRTARIPQGGETLHGHDFCTLPGGKGANQAVACARLGCQVAMIGKVGVDDFGRTLSKGLEDDGIDIGHVGQSEHAGSGVAMILVEDAGQNRILLAAGANNALGKADIDAARSLIESAAMLVLQLEVPLDTVIYAMQMAQAAGVHVLLNPAPAQALPAELWSCVDILVPNESEAELLTGQAIHSLEDAYLAARQLRSHGVKQVLLTLGENGVALVDDQGERHLPAQKVLAVDTTAAGDTFIGGLCAGLVAGLSLDDAAALGQRASALCVTRMGAQPSIPYRHELA